MTFIIRYELSNDVHESSVSLDRIDVTSIQQPMSRQSDSNTENTSSNNSDSSVSNSDRCNKEDSDDKVPAETLTVQLNIQTFHSLLNGAFVFDVHDKLSNMKLFTYLKDGMNNTNGWLRSVIQKKSVVDPKVHMTQAENHILVIVGLLFCGHTPRNSQFRDYLSSICHAFDILFVNQ